MQTSTITDRPYNAAEMLYDNVLDYKLTSINLTENQGSLLS